MQVEILVIISSNRVWWGVVGLEAAGSRIRIL